MRERQEFKVLPYQPRLRIALEVAGISAAGGILGAHGMFEVLKTSGWQEMEALSQIRPLLMALAGGFTGIMGFGFGFDLDKFLQRSNLP